MIRSSFVAPAATCGILATLLLGAAAQADEEIVATVGETRVRALVDHDSGTVETARIEAKVDSGADAWTVAESDTEVVEEVIEASDAGDGLAFDDCNDNGVDDLLEIGDGSSDDANGNLVPDRCEYDFGDLNLDGEIDGADIFIVLGWFASPFPVFGDLNADGIVDSGDMGLLLSRWGTSPF